MFHYSGISEFNNRAVILQHRVYKSVLQSALILNDVLKPGEIVKTKIYKNESARNPIYYGFSSAADLVRSVYGHSGRNVMSTQVTGRPHAAVKVIDAVRFLEDIDPAINVGYQFARALCEDVDDIAGDGSATAVLICSELLTEGRKLIAAGASPVQLKSGILKAASVAAAQILSGKASVDSRNVVLNIASTAGHSKEIGILVRDALEAVNWTGKISVRASETSKSYIQHADGMSFDRGYCSPYMSTDKVSMETRFSDAVIFVCESKIERINDILPLLNEASISGQPLLIIAKDFSQKVLESMLSNIAQQTIRLCAVKAPGFALGIRDYLEDIAAYTGTVVFGTEVAPELELASVKSCGRAGKVRVTRDKTTISQGKGPSLDTYISGLKTLLINAPNELARERLESRIAELCGNSATLRVGADTEAERELMTSLAKTAVRTAQSAIRSGVVPGGGSAFIHVIPAVGDLCDTLCGDERSGAALLQKALSAPARQLSENAGYNGSATVSKLLEAENSVVFDTVSNTYCQYNEVGIADSAHVLTTALTKASSMASELLTIEAMVLPDEPPKPKETVPDSLFVEPGDLI